MKSKKIFALLLTFSLFMTTSAFVITPAMAVEWDREQFYKDSISQYGAIDLSDPQLIADENFFGEWSGSEWMREPMLYYEMYPGLSEVEAAAKEGNYDDAKAALLEYYRAKHKTYNLSVEGRGSVSNKKRAQYEAAFDNFMPAYLNSISARINFDETDSWQTTDLLSDVKDRATNAGKDLKLQLVAPKKDGYMVEIDTRESEFVPYVRVLVNGSYKNFYATADTYVCGLEPDAVQGGKETMLVEESVSSLNARAVNVEEGILRSYKDEYTKVSFLNFDFTGLTANDQITEATLYLHGRMIESDCPEGIRIPSTVKSVFVMPFVRGPVAIDEAGLTYTVYMGYTNDYTAWDGQLSPTFGLNSQGYRTNNYVVKWTEYTEDVSLGYRRTGDETFAWHAIRMMIGMIKEFGTYEQMVEIDLEGGLNAGPIDGTFYAGQLGSSQQTFILRLINSEMMTPDAFSTFIKHMYNVAKFNVTQWSANDEGGNWGTYSNRGMLTLTMHYPEFRDAHGPLLTDEEGNYILADPKYPGSVQGGFIAVAKYRLGYKIFDDFDENGVSVEGSMSYAAEAWHNQAQPIRQAATLNVDPLDYLSEDMIERLTAGAYYILGHLNPWAGAYQVGDGGDAYMTTTYTFLSRLKYILEVNPEPELKYLISQGKEGKEPDWLAAIHDAKGWVTFRNSWNQNAIGVNIVGAGNAGGHGHNDDLSITLAAFGKYLLIDPKMNLYATSEPNERWLSSTRGHNTVMINNTVGLGSRNYQPGNGMERIGGVLQGEDIFGEYTYYPVYQEQTEVTGVCDFHPENRENNTVYDYIRGESFAYTNNNAMKSDFQVLRDTLFVHKGYIVVTDYIKPEDMTTENEYEQMWHFMPESNSTMDAQTETFRTNYDNEANVIVATVDGDDTIDQMLKPGIYAVSKDENISTHYGVYEQHKTGVATYNTIIYPMTSAQDLSIHTSPLNLDVEDYEANAFEAQVVDEKSGTTSKIQYYTLFEEDLKEERTFGDYVTDSVLALADKGVQGYSAAVLRKGKTLLDTTTDSYVIYSNAEIQDLGVEWSEATIKLATTHMEGDDRLDLAQLSILANNEVEEVLLNGQSIPFKQQGKYVYFGLNPLIQDETDFEDTDADENVTPDVPLHGSGSSNNSSSGSSSGGKGGSSGGSSSGGVIIGGTGNSGSNETTQTFNDISNHWAADYIRQAAEAGIINGDENGNFNPEKSVSRAELLAMAMRAIGAEEVTYDRTFTDVETEHWYSGAVAQALSLGIISPDLWFRPNDAVTREEMCKILVGVTEKLGIEQPEDAEAIDFADGDSISAWAKPYVDTAVKLCLMNGMEDNTFRGRETASRAQAVTVIQRALEKIKK